MRPRVKFLNDRLIVEIISEAIKLLVLKGVNLNHPTLLQRLADRGCRVDFGKRCVKFTGDIIEDSLRSVPQSIKLWNIEGTEYCDLSGDKVHFTPGSAAIKMLEYGTNQVRLATIDDMLQYTRIVEHLGNIDYSATAVVPDDVPRMIGDSIRLYALLKMTRKPIVTGAFTIAGFDVMRDLLLVVRGSKEALREKPLTIFSCCPTSPFKWSDVTSDNTMKCAELGIPVEFITMPLAGLVSPISLVGCLIQHTAETLSGIVISQTTKPGAPILYGGSPGTFNMRTMMPGIATLEAQMIDCAYAEIGQYLRIPTQAYIGLSDSKTLDGQAGFESGTGAYLATLAGINSISGPGMLFHESVQSLEKLVFDNEICGMSKRLAAGIEVREDFPSDALFDELLQSKTLLIAEHTLKYIGVEHYVPGPTIDRASLRENKPPLTETAHNEVQKLLNKDPVCVLSTDQLHELSSVMQNAAGEFKVSF